MNISPDIHRRFYFFPHRLPARLSLPEQVYLSAHTALCVSLIQCVLVGGGSLAAAALDLCVSQAPPQTASQAPHCVGSCSSLVSSCHPTFLSSLDLFLPQPFNHQQLPFLKNFNTINFHGTQSKSFVDNYIELTLHFLSRYFKSDYSLIRWNVL